MALQVFSLSGLPGFQRRSATARKDRLRFSSRIDRLPAAAKRIGERVETEGLWQSQIGSGRKGNRSRIRSLYPNKIVAVPFAPSLLPRTGPSSPFLSSIPIPLRRRLRQSIRDALSDSCPNRRGEIGQHRHHHQQHRHHHHGRRQFRLPPRWQIQLRCRKFQLRHRPEAVCHSFRPELLP